MARKSAHPKPACDDRHPLWILREALGLTREEMAQHIKRSRPFVSMVERDVCHLGRETVLFLLDRHRPLLTELGITAEDLIRGRVRAPGWRRAA